MFNVRGDKNAMEFLPNEVQGVKVNKIESYDVFTSVSGLCGITHGNENSNQGANNFSLTNRFGFGGICPGMF